MTTKTFSISADKNDSGRRLDKFLAGRFSDYSRSYFQRLIEKGKITINGRPAEKDNSLKAGDLVFGEFEPVAEISVAPDNFVKFRVVYDADEFAVVEKPAGLVTHPSATHKSGTLVNGLLARWPEIAGVGDPSASSGQVNLRPGIVHRLDKETSGLMVVAKTQSMYLWLKKQFHDRLVEKRYIALVAGKMTQKEGEITASIARRKTKQVAVPDANKGFSGKAYKSRKAATAFKILSFYPVRSSRVAVLRTRAKGASAASNGVYDGFTPLEVSRPEAAEAVPLAGRLLTGFTLVEATPKTGRMHQIRVHFKHIGHPLVGDKTYASKRVLSFLPSDRHFLHAGHLGFTLPSGEKVEFSSDLPADLKKVLSGLAPPLKSA